MEQPAKFYAAASVFSFFLVGGVFVSQLPRFAQSTAPQVIQQHEQSVSTEREDTSPIEPTPTPTASLLAVGDIMLDRSVWLKTKTVGNFHHPFLLIDPLLGQYDVALANLEGPITTFPSVANGEGASRLIFTFSQEFVEPLAQRFQFLSLANNHTDNFGAKGLDQTRRFLDDAGIVYFGDPHNQADFLSATTTVNDIRLGFVGYHQLVQYGLDTVVSEARRLAPQVDVLIIMPHWGTEYITDNPTVQQRSEAQAFIDAGADVVIGAHPHVVQPIEMYNNRLIFYSLGNFIFDQYFSEETMTGLAVGMAIEKKDASVTIDYTLIPLDINKQSQPSVADIDKRQSVLQHIYTFSQVAPSMHEDLKSGSISTSFVN